MAALDRSGRAVVSVVRALCHRALDAPAFREKLGDQLRAALGADASCVMDLDPLLSFPVHALEHGWPAEAREPLAGVLLATPAADPRGSIRSGRGAVDADSLVQGRLQDDPYFREHIFAFGYRHEIQVPCVSMARGHAFLCFTRKARAGRFEDRHLALLGAIAPHVAAATHAASLRQRISAGADGGVGMIVLDACNRVELANVVGERWLRHATSPGRQYLLALRAMSSLLTRLETDGPAEIPELLLADPETGAPTLLRGERRMGGNGDPKTVVLLQPSPLARHPAALVALGLTPRETEVAIAIARGLSAKEIANELHLSVHTVNDHSKAVFDKLGVSSRVALTLRLLGP